MRRTQGGSRATMGQSVAIEDLVVILFTLHASKEQPRDAIPSLHREKSTLVAGFKCTWVICGAKRLSSVARRPLAYLSQHGGITPACVIRILILPPLTSFRPLCRDLHTLIHKRRQRRLRRRPRNDKLFHHILMHLLALRHVIGISFNQHLLSRRIYHLYTVNAKRRMVVLPK